MGLLFTIESSMFIAKQTTLNPISKRFYFFFPLAELP